MKRVLPSPYDSLCPLRPLQQKQLKLGDKMDLWSYLLKPVQRISKYSLLLQDMMRECTPDQTREISEIKAAMEVINFQLRHGNNLLAMDAIRHCDVSTSSQSILYLMYSSICLDMFGSFNNINITVWNSM